MKWAALVALAACSSPPAPHPPVSSTAPATRREPVLLYVVGTDARRVRWIAASGGAPHDVAGSELEHLTALWFVGDSTSGVWLSGTWNEMSRRLVRAVFTGEDVELRTVEPMLNGAISTDGAYIASACEDVATQGVVCVSPIGFPHLGRAVALAGAKDGDRAIGWRAGQVIVWNDSQLAFLSRAGARTQLAALPPNDGVAIAPDGATVAVVMRQGASARVMDLEDLRPRFTATPAEQLQLCRLPTATTLVCRETAPRGTAALVVYAPERRVIGADNAGAIAGAGRIAFQDGDKLVATDLHGEHRVVLVDIPAGTTVTPVAWLP